MCFFENTGNSIIMPWKRFTDEEAVAFYRRFGQNIHYLRKQKAMSQDELAERVDCSQKYISKIELGQAKPSAVLCSRIAAALQCSADTLFTDVLSGEQTKNFIVSASERMLTDEVLRVVEEYLQRQK